MPDTIKISELDEALAIADAAEFPYTQENGGELTTFKAPLTQIAAKVVEDMSYAGIDLPAGAGVKSVENTLNYLLGAVGGNPNENIATEYDPTATYAKGDYVIYENVLYICTDSDGTTGTFDPAAWSQTELAEHTAENAANIGNLSTLTTTDKSSIVGAVNEVNRKSKVIYSTTTYSNQIGTTITTTNNMSDFRFLRITIGVSSFDSWNITYILIPNCNSTSTGYYQFASNNVGGKIIRLSTDANTTISLISSSEVSIGIYQVVGIY